ncbi:MAG: sulfite exporter TauE/SafE family protein [Chloroflexi bacterium]|nr:sulfite exporter TauE/SafE family protein [Chloroflexota bacterium]
MMTLLSVWSESPLSDLSTVEIVLLSVLAFGVAYVSGMVGMALGVVRLPLLIAFGISVPVAAGVNLAVSVVTAMTSGWEHYRSGRIAFRVVILIGFPSFIGAFVGSLASDSIRVWILLSLVTLVLLWSGLVALARALRSRDSEDSQPESMQQPLPGTRRLLLETAVGFLIGVLGGAVGLVLGTVRMPALVNVLKLHPAIAVGTNTIIGLLVGASGFVGKLINGDVDVLLIALLGITGMVGSYLGALRTGQMNTNNLRLAIGIVLIVVAPFMGVRAAIEFPN